MRPRYRSRYPHPKPQQASSQIPIPIPIPIQIQIPSPRPSQKQSRRSQSQSQSPRQWRQNQSQHQHPRRSPNRANQVRSRQTPRPCSRLKHHPRNRKQGVDRWSSDACFLFPAPARHAQGLTTAGTATRRKTCRCATASGTPPVRAHTLALGPGPVPAPWHHVRPTTSGGGALRGDDALPPAAAQPRALRPPAPRLLELRRGGVPSG